MNRYKLKKVHFIFIEIIPGLILLFQNVFDTFFPVIERNTQFIIYTFFFFSNTGDLFLKLLIEMLRENNLY